MIVVTGATGNVGLALARVLTEAGEEVTAVSRAVAAAVLPDGVRHRRAESYAPLRRIEDVIERSGLEWTHLRRGAFASNALAWASSARAEHTIAAPFADIALPVVDPQDIAEVAATTLRRSGHDGRTYVLTGPEPISPRQRAHIIGDVLGEPITFVELTREQAREQLAAAMPEPLIEGTLGFNGAPTPEEQQVNPDAATVLARPPRPFTDWARRNIRAFREEGPRS
jgi:uncharacterized protein YbjT (DUF2867 family)